MKAIIEYDELAPEDRPQDDSQTGEDWTFETLEHDEMSFPRAIRATDAEGRSCIYLAEGTEGQAINIKWIEFKAH
jgi:hypothetical protein